jgi:hypothetical protein
LLWSSNQSERTLSAYYGQGFKKYLRHSKRRAATEVGRSWMQYVVTGGFGTVEEAVWVERNESMLAYCTLLQLSGNLTTYNCEELVDVPFWGSLWRGRAPVAGFGLGWVGWVGKDVPVSCMGVQLCNPPKIRTTIVASLRLFY